VTVRVALVGLGYWGPNLARTLSSLKGGVLAAICDSDGTRVARYAEQYPRARAVQSYDMIVDDPTIDAIVLATPVETHFPLALRALEAGKHVLVEKPLARTTDECRRLIAEAEGRSLILMAGHVFLYNAAVRKVRDYIESDELGEIYYVYSQRLNLGQVRHDVNALWNFAPHDLSILSYWLGAAPHSVIARGFSYLQPDIEDVVFMTLEYPQGVGANVHISWLDPHKVRLMTVVGSKKMIVYDDVSADSRLTLYDKGVTRAAAVRDDASLGRYESFGEFQLLLRAGDVLIPKVDFVEPLHTECQHFIDCIVDGGRPISDGWDGLRVVQALEAAQRSMELAGSSVRVDG
jgi:predicted dehydrogenase